MKTSIPHSIVTTLVIGGLCVATQAQAADLSTGPYVSANVGAGVSSLQKGGIDSALGAQGIGVSSGTSGTQDTTYGLSLGYRFTPNLAAEVGYVNLGKFGYQSNVSGASNAAVVGEFKSQGMTAAALGILPLPHNVSVYGKLGLIRADTELRASGSNGVDTVNTSHYSTGSLVGLGASYDITPKVATRVEWNRYGNLGNPSTGYGSVNTYTVGLAYKF